MNPTEAKPLIGILALQGDFQAHKHALERAGADVVEVRTQQDLGKVDGLVIPGGESTTMLKLMKEENFFEPVRDFGAAKPVFGTCAGTILLATDVLHPRQEALGLMDLTVERNAYGRQIDSRIAKLDLDSKPLEAVFIRAPVIRRTGSAVQVLLKYMDAPVLVEQGRHMAATFHPELTRDGRIHERFVEKVRENQNENCVSGV